MKRFIVLVLLGCSLNNNGIDHSKSGITFNLNGGRFGDCIMNYIRAKFIAFQKNVGNFYFHPFAHSHVLNAHQLEKHLTFQVKKQYPKKISIKDADKIDVLPSPSLFFTNFYTRYHIDNNQLGFFEETIKFPEFGNEIKRMIQPCVEVKKMELPEDKVTVAVHIRKGSGNDGPLNSIQTYDGHQQYLSYEKYIVPRNVINPRSEKFAVLKEPLKDLENNILIDTPIFRSDKGNHGSKFPPEQFYIDQIKTISELLGHPPMYVFLFTDHSKPWVLQEKFSQIINLPNITFDSHKKHNYANTFVDDYYNMAQFDCLIRPVSSFSIAAQFLGNHSIIMYPKIVAWVEKKLIVTKTAILHCY